MFTVKGKDMWKKHQKVISATEPEIGLGEVSDVIDSSFIEVTFPLSGEREDTLSKSSPIKIYFKRRSKSEL